MKHEFIEVKGARENNLQNIDVKIPRDSLTVFTGLSGSGKSSLAFDTIYAEGQRRYMQSLSSYARMFIGQMEKPDVDSIDGLSPAISIDQKSTSRNPRSTVGTVTEIYDYLRLLYARTGVPHCPNCGREIKATTIDQMTDAVMRLPEGIRVQLLAPVVRSRKGEYAKLFESLRKNGYARVRVDGEVYSLDEEIVLEKYKNHNIEVIVDRLVMRPDLRRRVAESLETVLRLAAGLAVIAISPGTGMTYRIFEKVRGCMPGVDAGIDEILLKEDDKATLEVLFSQNFACAECGISLPEITPRMFSFNSPAGACPACSGIGRIVQFIEEDFIAKISHRTTYDVLMAMLLDNNLTEKLAIIESLGKVYKFDVNVPVGELPREIASVVVSGSGDKNVPFNNGYKLLRQPYVGIMNVLKKHYARKLEGAFEMYPVEYYMSENVCPECGGKRLSKESLCITLDGLNISQFTELSIRGALDFMNGLRLTGEKEVISRDIVKEIKGRLSFLTNVGLEYLTLARSSGTLSGGESQRIRLATQIGAGLMGVLYILDEPSIGLHQRDNQKLLATLKSLRDLGNTLIVVEHDEETMLSADCIVDVGPLAGIHGGRIVAVGTPEEIMKCPESLTGMYLSGRLKIPVPETRRQGSGKKLTVKGLRVNNLKNIDVTVPLGRFVCVTGVSGSGKSSFVNEVLARMYTDADPVGRSYTASEGKENIDKCICIDQSPIGRTPRSNPATYVGVFTQIRDLFAMLPESRARGYKSGRFSFNTKGGRCEACSGDGIKKIEMHFLPDVYVPCEVCKGKRYNRETLEIRYRGKNISEVLEMTIDEAAEFFTDMPAIQRKISTLVDVGLGYMKLGQSSTTLSGGEAQRIKLAAELSRIGTGNTLYILDEPTTGLHTHDVKKLIEILDRLVDAGNTVVVIEHNLDVIKCADHIIDLGPEGGDAGGTVVAEGTPEEVAQAPGSYTGEFLKRVLK
ncbi:MAG: excinuclease ABC subunit UvrA [Clostridia bacterium]|nr:excinuclease ABC subunit UvrA [Clostridia bacterium]MBQ3867308.1 excinuclease ABC subunit UvrA [Clostridia bacterium]